MKLPIIVTTNGKIDKNKAIALFGSLFLFVLLLVSESRKLPGLLGNGNVITVISGAVITALGLITYSKFEEKEVKVEIKEKKKNRRKR